MLTHLRPLWSIYVRSALSENVAQNKDVFPSILLLPKRSRRTQLYRLGYLIMDDENYRNVALVKVKTYWKWHIFWPGRRNWRGRRNWKKSFLPLLWLPKRSSRTQLYRLGFQRIWAAYRWNHHKKIVATVCGTFFCDIRFWRKLLWQLFWKIKSSYHCNTFPVLKSFNLFHFSWNLVKISLVYSAQIRDTYADR